MITKSTSEASVLTLGWQVTPTQDPRYWLNSDAKSGAQTSNELVLIPARSVGAHTVIVAQSGSGKSFFLGRLIEEIILQTRARCVILDPNADFRKISDVESANLWEGAKYNPVERRGKLPHEAFREEFSNKWQQVQIRVRTGTSAGRSITTSNDNYEQLKLWWPSLAMAFLAEDLDPMLRSDLYHCHSFVKSLGRVSRIPYLANESNLDLIDEAQKIFRLARGLEKQDLRKAINQEFDITRVFTKMKPVFEGETEEWFSVGPENHEFIITRSWLQNNIDGFIELALTINDYVSSDVERFYFGKAREYQAAGILETRAGAEPVTHSRPIRLDVVDLPSLPDHSTRLLAMNAILTTEWERVRNIWSRALDRPINDDRRVPTFIIVDEAHNVIPSDPRGKPASVLREQFRTIAAEGRKYGLYLILVSQRPDKLDPLVVSECENKAIMRLGSGSVLKVTREMLGLDDLPPKLLEKCMDFETGRVLITGRWAPNGPQIIYSAARRTVEGGRNLREEYWARPPVSVPRSISLPSSVRAKTKSSSKKSASKKPAQAANKRSPKKKVSSTSMKK